MKWGTEDIPDQRGRIVVITGANIGLGYESALALARKGAQVIMTCRNPDKCQSACQEIARVAPGSSLTMMQLDLASLESVRNFAGAFSEQYFRLDILMNNAGIMAVPKSKSADGYERQFATNHLGHFALTGYLLERLLETPKSRVVTVSSAVSLIGRMHFSDPNLNSGYNPWIAYAHSKLANLYFAEELQRRLEKSAATTISLAAHPGFAATNLRSGMYENDKRRPNRTLEHLMELPAQSAAAGALPQLYAATAENVRGGEYYGPSRLFQQHGPPKLIRRLRPRVDPEKAARLWSLSEEMTGIRYLDE